jgi:hypothetical protein
LDRVPGRVNIVLTRLYYTFHVYRAATSLTL